MELNLNNLTPRLIELYSLQSNNSIFSLKAKTTIKKKAVYLEIDLDENTYKHMKQIVRTDENARYRISLRFIWDPFREEYLSKITKINGPLVASYDFACSKEYVEILQQLISIHESKKLPNIKNVTYSSVAIQGQIDTSKPKEKVSKTTRIRKVKYAKPLLGVAVAIGLLFVSLNNIFININVFPGSNEKAVVSIDSEVNRPIASAGIKDEYIKNKITQEITDSKEISAIQSNVMNLEENITYGLPEGYAAITFDDGPSKYTKQIIDILNEYEIGATFFFIGQNSLKYPDNVKYAQENNMSIGIHSWDHSDLTTFSSEEQKRDFVKTSQAISSILGESVKLFRPPYGAVDSLLRQNTMDEDLKMVLWNRDPEDWKAKSAEELVMYSKKVKTSGSVFLFHEKEHTVEALPRIIEHLKQNNIKIVVLK